MPIVVYFAVAGSMLLGLLFAVDATLAPQAVRNTSNFYGLPTATAQAGRPGGPTSVTAPAPEPDMNSPAVLAASPTATAPATAAIPSADAAMAQAAKPAKRSHIARKPHDDHRTGNGFGFGGFNNGVAFDRPRQDNNRRWAARNAQPWSTWR